MGHGVFAKPIRARGARHEPHFDNKPESANQGDERYKQEPSGSVSIMGAFDVGGEKAAGEECVRGQ